MSPKSITLRFFTVTFGFLMFACDVPIPYIDEITRADPCDPIFNHYLAEKHFIERDHVTRDGNIDYNKFLELSELRASPCDPLYGYSDSQREREFDDIFSVLRDE